MTRGGAPVGEVRGGLDRKRHSRLLDAALGCGGLLSGREVWMPRRTSRLSQYRAAAARPHHPGHHRLQDPGRRPESLAVHDRAGWPTAVPNLSTAAWTLAPRNRFIGRTPQLPEKNLPLSWSTSRDSSSCPESACSICARTFSPSSAGNCPGLDGALQRHARAHRYLRRDAALHWHRLEGLRMDPCRDHQVMRALRSAQAVRRAPEVPLAQAPAKRLETHAQSEQISPIAAWRKAYPNGYWLR